MDKVVHFEIPYDEGDRAKSFYKDVFGWQTQEVPEMKYTMVHSVVVDEKTRMPKESGAINGGMFQRDSSMPYPMFYMNVEDIDKTLEKIKEKGGEVVREKMPVGDMGFVGHFKDTEGNILGLWENAK